MEGRCFGNKLPKYHYNLLNRIDWPDETNTQFVSDAVGNRLRMTTSTGVQYDFMYDTTAGIPAVLMEKTGADPAKLYIRTPDGRLIARVTANITSPALDFYYHFDGLGSALALTNSSGNATDTYTYDAWGKLTNHTGETDQPYQFVGQLGYYTNYQDIKLDPESQDTNKYVMLQLGVRYYAPEMGRFTQRDQVADTYAATYTYVRDLPTHYVDPSGLIWCERINRFPWFWCHLGSRPRRSPGVRVPSIPRIPGPVQSAADCCADSARVMDRGRVCARMREHFDDGAPDPLVDQFIGRYGDPSGWSATAWQMRCEAWLAGQEGTPSFSGTLEQWVRLYGSAWRSCR